MNQRVMLALRHVAAKMGVLFLIAAFAVQTLPAMAAPAENAFVRVVHAAPAAGNVDVFVDGGKLLSNFAFGTVTGYVPVAAGPHRIQVAPAGKGIGGAVIDQTVSVDAGAVYTVAAIGADAKSFGLAAFSDNNLMDPSQAKVRVYHLSPNAGPVDVAAGGNKVITALTYKNASDYLSVAPAAYTFNVTATSANATVPVSATLSAGTVNSVFAVGLFKGSPALKFVLATVNGVPGMPGTGSDPRPVAPVSTPFLPGLLGITGLLLIGSGFAARRFVGKR
ncbi:MAG: DUF4397 domain-containing protein [Ktedonobacteraceae bacterium]|nr:DUF4397 domain-containing protein [Ktedonobacteraceae bacterium]